MQFQLINTLANSKAECLVLGFFSDEKHEEEDHLIRLKEKLSESGDSFSHMDETGKLILLIQCGKAAEFNKKQFLKRLDDVCGLLKKHRVKEATISLPLVTTQTPAWQVKQTIIKLKTCFYQFNEFKTIHKKEYQLETISLFIPGATEHDREIGDAVAQGMDLTRYLVDLPANHCTPTFLGEQAKALAKTHKQLHATIHSLRDIQKLGMGSFLSVAQGSEQPPVFIELRYEGAKDKKAAPIVLVGKGVTFDSGGLSIKPANGMEDMKYDMAGAGSVFGTIKTCALLNLPVNVIGLMPCTENLINGKATKPGDIVTSLSGQTIEITNTDAEGRLILADALTYAERFNPALVIDIATLTGAMLIALGTFISGMMTNDEELAQALEQAGEESNDRVWRFPLDEEFQEALDSNIADMINLKFDRLAGSIVAACFLERFAKKYRWAHLDIAGTAWFSGKNKGASGRPVPLLVQLIMNHAATC